MSSGEPRFLGTHAATIDPEGRIQLPTALRDEVNLRQPDFGFVATLDGGGSVCLRVRDSFEAWAGALRGRASTREADRRTLLTVAAHTAPVRCDKQGRVRIPDALLSLIGVDRSSKGGRDVVLVGGFDEVHVWSPVGWEAWSESARRELSSGLDALGAEPRGASASVADRDGVA